MKIETTIEIRKKKTDGQENDKSNKKQVVVSKKEKTREIENLTRYFNSYLKE